MSVGVCYTAVDAAAGGLTTGWWAVVLECFSSHPLWYLWLEEWWAVVLECFSSHPLVDIGKTAVLTRD